jgi:signal transduction histidine kinase
MVVSALGRRVRDSMRQRPFSVRLPQRRRKAAWVLAVAGPTLITLGSRLLGSSVPPASALFSILLVVVIVALVGGWRAALTAVLVGLVAQEVLFTFPYGSLNNHDPAQLSVLVAFVVIGAAVGILVDDLRLLTEEQAALRRIAMLVATEAPTNTLFTAVTEQVGQLLRVEFAGVGRLAFDGSITVVAGWSRVGVPFPVGASWSLDGECLGTPIARAGVLARIHSSDDGSGSDAHALRESGSRSAVGMPITVEGRLWGMMIAASTVERPLPANTETRLVGFTDLLATAIANAESRADLASLADEQAALQRVATLVARAAPQGELFSSVTEEVARLLQADHTTMSRYESDGTATIIAGWRRDGDHLAVGIRRPLGGKNLITLVGESGESARIDNYTDVSGALAEVIREIGSRSGVGAPIIVEGRLWGVMIAGAVADEPLPADSEARLASFTDLVAIAIANAESRADLAASRARIVATADETRRRIERDLHDGAQQRLVSLALGLRAAQAAVPPHLGELEGELSRVADEFASVQEELREFARGIHPAILAEGGLGPALKTLARRSPVPVILDLRVEARLSERVEIATYYVVSEALTNVAKHARASVAHVRVEVVDGGLRVSVQDDGAGGADPTQGSGLMGLRDRVEALDGAMTIRTTRGEGTSVQVEVPVND